jgi:hypothetical protein
MPRRKADPAPIVVAGDVSIDWLAWPKGAREADPANWRNREGTRMVARRGGALLLTDLLRHATTGDVVGPLLTRIELKSPDEYLHSIVDLKSLAGEPKCFHIDRLRGFSGPEGGDPKQLPLDGPIKGATVLVLDDSGNGFREADANWANLIAETRPRWLIVKMARPRASGRMWRRVREGPIGTDRKRHPERVIIVVNADDLREEAVALRRHLSWERTAEEFVRELRGNSKLKALASSAHLIVRFSCDGVIHHRGRGRAESTLYFDPIFAEGDFVKSPRGRMTGMTSAFTAGLAAALAEDGNKADIGKAIKRGMAAAHRLAKAGFCPDAQGAPDYPHVQAMTPTPRPERPIYALKIPHDRIVAGETWSILNNELGADPIYDITYIARGVFNAGPEAALTKVPVARFGELATADRGEIESYRAISNLLSDYLAMPRAKPISIGVFGPPGAGKSFGLKEVAKYVRPTGSEKPPVLEFNLSQFTGLGDLITAFHLIRDQALSGIAPLVFFDEFDSKFGSEELGWLRYFLAPMQDGKFRESGHTHPLGGAIFAFAGGTRVSFADFVSPLTKRKTHPEYKQFVAVKGPDFASRLSGFIDIRGPNKVDGQDRMFPIRRAFMLRSMLKRRDTLLKSVDDGVLNALLTVDRYRHGSRSMETVLGMSLLTNQTKFERSALPPAEQLESHVDAANFTLQVTSERLDDEMRGALGRRLHDVYRKQRMATAEDDKSART